MTDFRDVRTIEHEQGRTQRVTTIKVTQVIWLVLGIVDGLIALRVLFNLISVNSDNPFAELLYKVTNFFVAPFSSLTSAPSAGGMVLEISSIIAMIVYLLIAWALVSIVNVLFYRPRGPVSVRQEVVSDHMPIQDQTVTTNRTTTQAPLGTNETTVTERTNTQTPVL